MTVFKPLTRGVAAIAPLAVLLCWAGPATATAFLGSAANFAVFGGSVVTNTGASTITGDIGVSPGTAISGIGLVTLNGTAHAGDAVATLAHADLEIAAAALAALTPTVDLSGQDLGTIGVLTPGVYHFASSAQLTGTLTLDFAGHPERPFIFQIGSALTTASASDVLVLGGGVNSGIYWNIGISATFGAGSGFVGNVLAKIALTAAAATRVSGRLFALNTAVTVDSATISNDCTDPAHCNGRRDFGSHGYAGPDATSAAPEVGTWVTMVLGFGAVGAMARRRRAGAVMAL